MARRRDGSSVPVECSWGWVEVDSKGWSGCAPLDLGGSWHPWEPTLAACTPGVVVGRGSSHSQPLPCLVLLTGIYFCRECAGVRHVGMPVGALEAWLEQGERFCSDICAWAELSTTWLMRDAVSLLLGESSLTMIWLHDHPGIKLLCCTSWCSIKT